MASPKFSKKELISRLIATLIGYLIGLYGPFTSSVDVTGLSSLSKALM